MANGREIIKAIVKDKQCPERMGLYEHYWDDTRAEWEKQGYPKDTDPIDYFDYDIKAVPNGWFRTTPFPVPLKTIDETDETFIYLNGWGAKLREWKGKSGTPEHISFEMVSEEIWREKFREPLLTFNIERAGDVEQLKKDFKTCMETDRFIVYTNVHIFEIMRHAMGDVVMLEAMYLNPAWIHDFCDVITNMMITQYEFMFSEIGIPDGMFIYEDMGYTYGPFCSPELQRELVFPYHRKLVDFVHSYDIPFIMHSCGKIRPFLPAIFDAGVDCLQVLEAKAGQDVREMAEATGYKMSFMGNLNILAFEANDPKTLENEVLPKLDGIREKRIPYVFHSDHSIPKTVKLDTYRYALELFRKYGKY
jgi:uroporphyrinogen decarboxylase